MLPLLFASKLSAFSYQLLAKQDAVDRFSLTTDNWQLTTDPRIADS